MMKKYWLLPVMAGMLLSCHNTRHLRSGTTAVKVLKDPTGWVTDTLSPGLIHYHFAGYYTPSAASQNVNVIEVDLNNPRYQLKIAEVRPSDSLSAVAARIPGALAAINGSYFEIVDGLYSGFFKSDDTIRTQVTIPKDHRLFWKHDAAFYYDTAQQTAGILYGNNESYNQLRYANVVSASPMLIYQYKPVGETFAKPRHTPLDSLDYEDPDRHQGVRHPRTAIALTSHKQVLLITVDGRDKQAAGMSARELTQFIQHYFRPEHALNLDGGGSTTLWIKNANTSTGVVNYPTDNKRFDHFGQRKIRNYIAVVEK